MNNANMPAMPTSPNDTDPEWSAARTGGLTKREMFAMAAMQGLSSCCDEYGAWAHDENLVAGIAVRYADALLAELEKTK